jgi:hypothetical protein
MKQASLVSQAFRPFGHLLIQRPAVNHLNRSGRQQKAKADSGVSIGMPSHRFQLHDHDMAMTP